MKKSNKKGFTIVELVIVIAVIAILAAVLIPTFSNITKKANKSGAFQECKHSLTAVLTEQNGYIADDVWFFVYKESDADNAKIYYYAENELKEVVIAEGKTVAETLPVADSETTYTATGKIYSAKGDAIVKTTAGYEDMSKNVTVYKYTVKVAD